MAALDLAQSKMGPTTPVDKGGCLSKFNPEWGRELSDSIWEKGMYLSCPSFVPSDSCAEHHDAGGTRMIPGQRATWRESSYSTLSFLDVAGCIAPGTTGLAGVIFHESLHAAGADNYTTERHNTAWLLQDYVFVSDRIYGTEALCFFGLDDERKRLVNVLQCRQAVSYRATAPRYDLCREFSADFTDIPAKFIKH